MYLAVNNKSEMVVECAAMHVYLPYEVKDTAYRGTPYYSLTGTKAKYLGVGWMRFFNKESEMDDLDKVKAHPLGIPMLITSEPSNIDSAELRFSKNGPLRKVIVLIFYKGDRFLVNTNTVKSGDAIMMELSRLDQGKRDMFLPETVITILRDCQRMNGLSLRIPSEEEEIFVVERYRDPNQPGKKYRFHTGAADPETMISHNSRIDVMKNTSFQAVMGEDFNTAALVAINKNDRGERDEAGLFESLVLGRDMTRFEEEDYPDEFSPNEDTQ